MTKTSEKLESLLCDPEGKVCIPCSQEDYIILTQAIQEVKKLEDNYNILLIRKRKEKYENDDK